MGNVVYGLVDPRSGMLRYVGISKVSAERRRRRHLKTARNGSGLPVHIWTRKLLSLGYEPLAVLIEETPDRQREILWIAHYRAAGLRLLNCTRGGDGLVCPTEETKRKMSESHKGKKPTAETREKLRLKSRGRRHTEAARERMAIHVKTIEHRQHLSQACRGRPGLKGDANGLRKHPESVLRGSANPLAKLTEEQVIEIRRNYIPGNPGTVQLARQYGVAQGVLYNALTGKTWQHVEEPPFQPTGSPRCHITPQQAKSARAAYESGERPLRGIYTRLGIPRHTFYRIISGKSHREVD